MYVLLRLNNICTGYPGWKDANHLKLSWIVFLKQSDFNEMQIKVTLHVSLALIHIFLLPMWYIRPTKSLKNGRKTETHEVLRAVSRLKHFDLKSIAIV